MKFTCQAYWANTDVSSSIELSSDKRNWRDFSFLYSGINLKLNDVVKLVYDTNDLYNRQQTYLDQQFEGNHGNVVFLFHKAIIL